MAETKKQYLLVRVIFTFASDLQLQRLFQGIMIGALIFFLVRQINYAINITLTSVPIDYREGAFLLNTEFLLVGKNPYTLENQPLNTNAYGIGYNFVVLPFAFIFGNSILVHRLVSIACIIIACLIIYRWLVFRGASKVFAVSGGLIAMASLMYFVNPVIRPDAFGTMLFLLTIFIPEKSRFNSVGLFTSALIGVLAFYTKPYFVLSLGILSGYLFTFVSKKKGVFYAFGSGLLLVIIAWIIRITSECYFLDTILINTSVAGRSKIMMIYQLIYFALVFLPVFLILAVALLERHQNKAAVSLQNIPRRSLFERICVSLDLYQLNTPLFSSKGSLPWFAFAMASLSIILILGQHLNNYVVYLFQLMTPLLLVGVFQYLNKKHNLFLVTVPLIIMNLYILNYFVLYPNDPTPYLEDWRHLKEIISKSENVLNSPAIAPLLIEMEKPVVDSGQSEYYYMTKPYPGSILAPNYQTIFKRGQEYKNNILETVQNKGYDLVIITEDYSPFVPVEILGQYYDYIKTLNAVMPQTNQNWRLQVWIPKE